jgi:hypothetical protein
LRGQYRSQRISRLVCRPFQAKHSIGKLKLA